MRPDDIRKLLGGYATGTLSEQERRALFDAALSDQEIFEELAGEQALKDLLEDPQARRQLLNAVGEKRPFSRRYTAWIGRPVAWAVAGGLAAAILVVTVYRRANTNAPAAKPQPVLMAKREVAPEPALERRVQPQPPVLVRRPAPPVEQQAQPQPAAPVRKPAPRENLIRVAPPSPTAAVAPPPPAAPEQKVQQKLIRVEPGAGVVGGIVPLAAPMMKASRADFAAQPSTIPYRILRSDTEGNYTEVEPSTAFRPSDRIRVAFEPPEDGRLQVAASKPLFDASVQRGVITTLDVPPGERRLEVSFFGQSRPQPTVFEIQIRYQ